VKDSPRGINPASSPIKISTRHIEYRERCWKLSVTMTDRDFPARWLLRGADQGQLIRLTKALHDLAPLARCGDDLIALGEAWGAIQQILDGCEVDVDVGLSVGFRRGSSDFEEGLFMCFRINDEVIILDELNTTYSANIGSDHFTTVYASLGPNGGFDDVRIEEWLAKLEEVQGFDDAHLEIERDHI
jgi:hypothetical protein